MILGATSCSRHYDHHETGEARRGMVKSFTQIPQLVVGKAGVKPFLTPKPCPPFPAPTALYLHLNLNFM